MNDEMIVELYFRRDEAAIVETRAKYEAYLMKIADNILSDRSDSEESVNDTYLAAWNAIPPQKPSVLRTFLAKLTRRISIDLFRRRGRLKRQSSEYASSLEELENMLSGEGSPEAEVEVKLLGEAIDRFLRTLGEVERSTFIGRYYYLDPMREVAHYSGMSEAKAKSMLFRTRCKLREYLIKEGFTV